MSGLFEYDFMIRALIGAVLVGALAPAFGVFMVLRRLSLIADTLSHVALTGVAIGVLTRASPPAVAMGATTVAAASIEEMRARRLMPGDAALAVFLYGALATAVMVFSIADGFNSSLFGYLFGSVLTVTAGDLWLVGGIMAVAGLFFFTFYSELAQTSFDTDLARTNGVRVHAVNIALAVLTGATITVSMRVVGVLLVGALIVIPALAALRVAKGMTWTIVFAVAFGVSVAIAGTVISYYADVAPGGAVVLTAVGTLALVELLHFALVRRRARPEPQAVHRHHAAPQPSAASEQLPLRLTEPDGGDGPDVQDATAASHPAPGQTSTRAPGNRRP
jgi:zinc transport system permease protein